MDQNFDEQAFYQMRDELGNKKVDGMTVREIMDAVSQLRAMDQRAVYMQDQTRQQLSRQMHRYQVPQRQPKIKKPRDPNRELAVGKYVLTIMAAVLCLGALCVFLASFWFFIPEPLQFALIMALGIAFWAVGAWRAEKAMRPFWLGVAGLGAGVCYIAILAGTSLWYLYGPAGAAVLVIIWAAMACRQCMQSRAVVFSIIAYIGGLMAIQLAGWMMDGADGSGIFPSFMAVSVAVTGFPAYVKLKKKFLLYTHGVYCFFASMMLGEYTGHAACLSGLALLGTCLYLLRYADYAKNKNGVAFNAFQAAVVSVYIAKFAAGYGLVGALAAAVIIFGCNFGAVSGYAVGTVFPLMILLSGASEIWPGMASVLPVVFAVALCGAWPWLGNLERRIAARAAYLYCVVMAVIPDSTFGYWSNTLLALVLLAGLALWYMHANNMQIWDDRDLEILAAAFIPGFLLASASTADLIWRFLPPAACVLTMQGWRMRSDKRFDDMSDRVKAAWHGLYGISYLALSSAIVPDVLRFRGSSMLQGACIALVLIISTAFLAWLAIKNGRAWQSVASCASSQWSLWAAAGVFGFSSHMILLDLAGMFLAAGCVALGFKFYKKPLRQCGLACAILYGLKLGIVDVMLSGSGAALGLLVAGGLSFGMSAAYNGLGRKYLKTENDSADA